MFKLSWIPYARERPTLWLTPECRQGAKNQFVSEMTEAEHGLFICLFILYTTHKHGAEDIRNKWGTMLSHGLQSNKEATESVNAAQNVINVS